MNAEGEVVHAFGRSCRDGVWVTGPICEWPPDFKDRGQIPPELLRLTTCKPCLVKRFVALLLRRRTEAARRRGK